MTATYDDPLDALRLFERERERSEQRMAALRAELDVVQKDRERLHQTLFTRPSEPPPPPPEARSGWIAFGIAVLLVAALFVFIGLQPPTPVVVRPIVVRRIVVADPAVAGPATPARAEPSPAVPATPPRPRGRHGMRAPRNPSATQLLEGLDRCHGDPTCGSR